MRKPLRRLTYIFALLLATLPATAQTWKPAKILFPNTPADQAAALLTLSGLTPGQLVTKPDIEKAIQTIGDTGLFVDLRYTVDDRALTFLLTPTPPTELLPAVFANLLFWKPEELPPLIHARVPLFTGEVPPGSALQQAVADALVALLADRGIHAQVEAVLAQDRVTGKKSVAYSITQPAVLIRQVNVEGVSALAGPKVFGMLHSFADTPYDRHSADAVQQRLLETYLDLGFLDIAVDPPTGAEPIVDGNRIFVDFTTSVHENGGQYLISGLEWPISPIVSRTDYERAVPLKAGDPASRIEMLSAARSVQTIFNNRGYLDAHLVRHDTKDPANHTVAYFFTVEPGELYHVKAVRTVGFNEQQQKDFDRFWKLTAGAPYDGTYASIFFFRNSNILSMRGLNPELDIKQNRTDHTVEMVISAKRTQGAN